MQGEAVPDQVSPEASVHLSEQAYRHILEAILSGRMPAGAPIQERRLAAEVGVSRSPMRDALGRLSGEGLLMRSSGGVLAVRAISLGDYLQSLDMRLLVEPSAAALAVRSIEAEELRRLDETLRAIESSEEVPPEARITFDDELHETIARRSGNGFMERTLREMRRYTTLYERQAGRAGGVQEDMAEHRAIADALGARDSEGAHRAMEAHLAGIRQRILRQF